MDMRVTQGMVGNSNALPSEGRGREFESRRVHQSRAKVGTIARAVSSPSDAAFKSRSFGPQMRTLSLPIMTLLTNMYGGRPDQHLEAGAVCRRRSAGLPLKRAQPSGRRVGAKP